MTPNKIYWSRRQTEDTWGDAGGKSVNLNWPWLARLAIHVLRIAEKIRKAVVGHG